MKNLTIEDIEFLNELAEEMRTQPYVGTASPRYWTIENKRRSTCIDDNAEDYEVYDEDGFIADNVEDLKEYIRDHYCDEDEEDNMCSIVEDFKGSTEDLTEILSEHTGGNYNAYPYQWEEFRVDNLCFLTMKEAKRHLELNYYHYHKDAHVYCCHVWRSPNIERLFEIIEKIGCTDPNWKKKQPC